MITKLTSSQIQVKISVDKFAFSDTQQLAEQANSASWIAQEDAKKSAQFGLSLRQSGFNLLVLGEQGGGRTTLMREAMLQEANSRLVNLRDLVALCAFERGESPLFIRLPAGEGGKLKSQLDQLIRNFVQTIAHFFVKLEVDPAAVKQVLLEKSQHFIQKELDAIKRQVQVKAEHTSVFSQYLQALEQDFNDYVESWQPRLEDENPFDNFINENWLNRYRANVLVDQHGMKTVPAMYDNNPSLQTLFGCLDGHVDHAGLPEFMRLRAGNLLKADGGILMLHLRDLLHDQQEGGMLLEKLHRFMRNGTLMIEESGGGQTHSASYAIQTPLQAEVKLVLLATREEYYQTLDDLPEFFAFFPIKVELAERVVANENTLQALALLVSKLCMQHAIPHANPESVATLIAWMHRLEEDQARIGTRFSELENMLLQSAAMTRQRRGEVISQDDVQAAITAQAQRSRYVESQVRQSIIDGEVLMQVHGEVVGQVNGLTHTDLGEASFGMPVRISARCFASRKGIMHIDRAVGMSGAHHDKGLLILQSWFNASFAADAPLHLGASIVFEQEYSLVDGDSASCAELFALLSALSGKPIRQGIAVTGALNQHGEVLPIGGLNEKIEGYFRVCQDLGLDGEQGVLIPARNQRHLVLSDDVVQAVETGKFSIYTMQHVEEGIAFLTNTGISTLNENGCYESDALMGCVQQTLTRFNSQASNKRNG